MSESRKRLMKALSEYESIKDDDAVKQLLRFEELERKPNLFTHRMADILRELKISDFSKKTEEESELVEEEKPAEEIEKTKLRKISRRSTRQAKPSVKSTMSKISGSSKKSSPRKSRSVVRASQPAHDSETSQLSKQKTSSEGSQVSLDVIHVINVNIKRELQQELKCEVGVDIFMEIPWKIISKTKLLNTIQRDQNLSPFSQYAPTLQIYPEEEILIGRANLFDSEEFLIAITIHGRNILLEEIKSAHLDKWNRIIKMSDFPIGVWKTLGSEADIENEVTRNKRPTLSYDCYIKKIHHETVYNEGFSYINYYTELKDGDLVRTENIQGAAFNKHVQASPKNQDSFAQTVPEIPVNSTTQFTFEMRVIENEERLKEVTIDWGMLNDTLVGFFYKVDTLLTYNEEYDLYRDDYEILASDGEQINMYPNIPYEHYLTMMTFIGTKGKGITSTSWHPSQSGLVAVSYGKNHVAKIGDLNMNTDDESIKSDSDEENFDNFQTTNKFDEHIKNLWKEQLQQLENDLKEQTFDSEDYNLAVESSTFLEQTKNLRLFEIIQEKKRFLKTPDVQDLYQEEKFEYPLFEGTKKKEKKRADQMENVNEIINRIMSREPTFLQRDYLFSGNFHWKLKIADDLINPMDLLLMKTKGSVPQKYIKTFLFREIWCGDSWNFGDDLKYSAIEINKDFRESGILALGFPTVPESKIFLPGFNSGDEIDYTLELNPWQWIDIWIEHCIYCAKNNIPMPKNIEETKHDFTDIDDDNDLPFSFLFNINSPVYEVEYEDINLQYFLCDNKKCHQCQFLINNLMSKEGKDHICLKFIMNKENPNEVDQVIIVPYENVHGIPDEQEENFVLKKKEKNIDVTDKDTEEGQYRSEEASNKFTEDENVDYDLIEDEYELPYCSLENGCLLRRLLPKYLKDSRTEKLFCDQCCITDKNKSSKALNNDNFLQTRQEENVDCKINDCYNPEATESDSSEASCEEEVEEDAVGDFFQISQNNSNPCELSGTNGRGIINKEDESITNTMDHDRSIEIGLEEKKESSTLLSEDTISNENNSLIKMKGKKCSTVDFSGWNKSGIILSTSGIFKGKDNYSDRFSTSSSSLTFQSSDGNHEELNRETEINKNDTCPFSFDNTDGVTCDSKFCPKINRNKNKRFNEECKEKRECEEVILDIKHVLEEPLDNSGDFSDETKKILTEELEKLQYGLRTKVVKQQFEELSSCESSQGLIESSDDEEDLDKLNSIHQVCIWSIANDIKPMRRLTSPFEITALSFCPHNGRFLAGGTSTGQVVLWDLEDQLEHKVHYMQERSDFDTLGFKHLERVMCWFKRLGPDQRIHITALSNKKNSHLDRIVDVTWLPPNVKISPSSGKYEELNQKDENSLQFMSISCDGVLKFWDVMSSPLPSAEPPNNKNAFQCPGQFKLPKELQKRESKYSELFLRWDPIFQVRFELRDNLAVKKFHLTCVSHDQVTYNYEKLTTDKKKEGRNIELQELYKVGVVHTDSMNNEALIGTVDGCILLFTWKPLPGTQEMRLDEKLIEQEGIAATLVQQFKPIHDGPITSIERHPNNNNVFLTAGGHMFAIWKIDKEDPLKWKRSLKCYITAVGWSQCQPSSFRVGRSDGCMEVWDLDESGNEPKMVLQITSGAIYVFTVPSLSVPRGLFGIADHRGILKFYYIPWEYQVSRPNEADIIFGKIEAEHDRKITMEKKAVENVYQVKKEIIDPLESETDMKQKESEEKIKKKDIIGCKKFKEELYKWYLRRRGKNSVWLDESEKKWYNKEEEYMIKTILKNKKINMKELDVAIAPLSRKEQHEMKVAVKILDVLEMADEIFRNAVQNLALIRDYSNKSQISLEIETMNFGDLSDVLEELEILFGESYEKSEEELEMFVKKHPINKEWTFAELCKKNQSIRDFWNDRRRLFNPEYKWARELIQEEVEKSGYKFSYYISHEESYLQKKYKRRIENIEKLKKKFGDDYDPYWDLKDRYSNRNVKSEISEEHTSETMKRFKEIYSLQSEKLSPKRPERDVNIILSKGSFYRKYMPAEKNVKWEKPITYEERAYSRSKMFKDKLGESDMTVTTEPSAFSTIESELSDSIEPLYDEDEVEDVRKSSLKNKLTPPAIEVSPEKSGQSVSSSSSNKGGDFIEEKEVTEVSVSFKENSVEDANLESEIFKDVTQKSKKIIDYKKEDITGIYQGGNDLRRLVKEKKLRGEEIIDLDDLSVSYESISGSIASSSPSPDMSLKSEDLYSDEWRVDADSEEEEFREQYKEYLEEASLRYDPPKTVPYDRSMYEDEPTDEWLEEDLMPMIKSHVKEKEKENEEREGEEDVIFVQPDLNLTINYEKEKEVTDKIERLESMGESPDVINIVPLPGGQKIEKIKHVFEKNCSQDIDFAKKTD